MNGLTRALGLAAVAVLLAAVSAAADSYSVVLANGTVIESRYPPRWAEEDLDKLLVLTEWGNPIALERADIREIRAAGKDRGFASELDPRARFVGAAPNDAPVPGAAPERPADGSLTGAVLDHLLRHSLAAIEGRLLSARANTVRQFAEPPVAGSTPGTGLPLWRGLATAYRPEDLIVQGLRLPPVDPMKGWVLGQPTEVPLEGLAAAPPAAFQASSPAPAAAGDG